MKKKNYLVITLMALCIIILTADNNIMSAVLTSVEKDFQVDTGDIGLMSFFFSIVGAAVSLFWGYYSDKVNRKMLFAASVLIAEIPCALTYFAPNWTVFFILRILTGIGVGLLSRLFFQWSVIFSIKKAVQWLPLF